MTYNQVQRDSADISKIDVGIKNKFSWNWLVEKDSNGMFLSEWVRKVDRAGEALCNICNYMLRYGAGGKCVLLRHAKEKDHKLRVAALVNNTSLPSSYQVNDTTEEACNIPYGAAPNIHSDAQCSKRVEPQLPKIPSFQDRVAHTEAFVVSYIAENSLPFSMAPKLMEFAKFMAKDPKVLAKISMSRETATYKLTDGLAPIIKEKIVESMRTSTFSMNVDECFSNNNLKVFSIIVSYFCEEAGECLVQHYRSKSFNVVNAINLANFVFETFKEDRIPHDNLVSNLSDSTNYMRGKKGGFETLLRNKIPHLQDVDGDVCHHAHNAAGKFVQPFGKVVEKFCTDLHTECKYSTDLRGYLTELCEILEIPYHMPPNYTEHRWLSVLTAADIDKELLPALTLLYYSWVDKDLKDVYKNDPDDLIQGSSSRAKSRVAAIQKACCSKSLTEAGKERKGRIVDKVFYQRLTAELHLHLYTYILPLIKSFVLVFEQKEPLVHRFHDEVLECMRTFLCCFIKVELIKGLSCKELMTFDVMKVDNHKQFSDWNLGRKTFQVLKKIEREEKEIFKKAVVLAFTQAAQYLQKKMPLDNKFLQCLSSLDPKCRGVELGSSMMKKLASFYPNIIKEEELDGYDTDVNKYHLLVDLPDWKDGETRLDHWWGEALKRHSLVYLGKIVKASLSIFTGPRVEQTFSLMNNTITSTTNRLLIDTFAALQTVKMELIASKQTSVQRYYRKIFLKSPINPWISKGIQKSYGVLKKRRADKRKMNAERLAALGVQPVVKKKKKTIHQRAEKVKKKSKGN